MRAIAWLLRVFCYLFHTILSIALLGFGGLAVLAGATNMKVQSLPWEGVALNRWLIALGLTGLVSVLLAITGKFRPLLALWSICVLAMLVRAVFLTPAMSFSGQSDFKDWLWLTGGAAVAVIGSFLVMTRRPA
jgi:hypothetical protein